MIQNCWLASRCNHVDCDKDFCMKKFRTETLFDKALLSERHKEDVMMRLDADLKDKDNFEFLSSIQKNIDKFVARGDSLYIVSPISGNGKTTWAIRLLKEYINRVWYKSDLDCKVLFIHVPKFLLELKERIRKPSPYADYILEHVADADLVVFDEVATKVATEFEHEHLLNLINTRVDAKKANIYTSNVSNEQFLINMGSRLYSRVIGSSGDNIVTLYGSDKRGMF